jgi:hypothetical protein
MTDQPTPETDAMFTDNVPDDCQIVAFCERLERERNAARAERDEHIARNNDALLRLHLTTAERDEARAERDALRADVARLREAIVQTIAEGGNELPEWVEAKMEKVLATPDK